MKCNTVSGILQAARRSKAGLSPSRFLGPVEISVGLWFCLAKPSLTGKIAFGETVTDRIKPLTG